LLGHERVTEPSRPEPVKSPDGLGPLLILAAVLAGQPHGAGNSIGQVT